MEKRRTETDADRKSMPLGMYNMPPKSNLPISPHYPTPNRVLISSAHDIILRKPSQMSSLQRRRQKSKGEKRRKTEPEAEIGLPAIRNFRHNHLVSVE